MTRKIILDVDTQIDFMTPEGKLYVPGAEKILPVIRKVMFNAMQVGIKVVSTVDAHEPSDPEFVDNGGPFPHHCMIGTYGQAKIMESKAYGDAYTFKFGTPLSADWYEHFNNHQQIILEKKCYDVFDDKLGNNNAVSVIGGSVSESRIIYVVGVATDYCVKAAVLGILGRCKNAVVYVVLDAIQGLDGSVAAIGEMSIAGARMINSREIKY